MTGADEFGPIPVVNVLFDDALCQCDIVWYLAPDPFVFERFKVFHGKPIIMDGICQFFPIQFLGEFLEHGDCPYDVSVVRNLFPVNFVLELLQKSFRSCKIFGQALPCLFCSDTLHEVIFNRSCHNKPYLLYIFGISRCKVRRRVRQPVAEVQRKSPHKVFYLLPVLR